TAQCLSDEESPFFIHCKDRESARLDRAIAGEVSAGDAAALAQQNPNEQSEKFNATENLKKWRKWRRRSTTSDETWRRIIYRS
ncbi:hypothetical protein PENTCL1PPCAC_18492, partial [Pristionchus entomophagus]